MSEIKKIRTVRHSIALDYALDLIDYEEMIWKGFCLDQFELGEISLKTMEQKFTGWNQT